MKEREWDSDKCSDMKQRLLDKLNVQEKSEQKLLGTIKKDLESIVITIQSIQSKQEEQDKEQPKGSRSSIFGHI